MTHVIRYEASLLLSDDRPLRTVSFHPEPLDGFAHAVAQALPGEYVGMVVDCLPVSFRALRRRVRGTNPSGWGAALSQVAGVGGRGTPAPALGTVEGSVARHEVREQASRLVAAPPILSLQVLIRAESPDRRRAIRLAREMGAGLAVFAEENRWRLHRVRWWDAPLFDHRWRTGRFAPRRRQLAPLGEVVGLVKPPTAACTGPVVRSVAGIGGVPDGMARWDGGADLLPIGEIETPDGWTPVAVRKRDTLFTSVSGRAGFGKTEACLNQFVAAVRGGDGGWYLDPHADALARMKPYLCERSVAERLVEINLAVDTEVIPTWNLLSMTIEKRAYGTDPTSPKIMQAMERKASALTQSFAAGVTWTGANTRALNLTEQAAGALLELALRLPDDLCPTVFQMTSMLGNERWRERVLPFLTPRRQEFWTERLGRQTGGDSAITPVTNLIDRLYASAPVRALFGSPTSTFDPRRAIDNGEVVLLCPSANELIGGMVSCFMVYGLLAAVLSRRDQPVEQRRLVWAWLDEAQSYDKDTGGSIAAGIEQGRKYGLRATVMSQSPLRLSEDTRRALATNRSHVLTAAVSPEDAGYLARQMNGQINPSDLVGLERYHLAGSVTIDGGHSDPFVVRGFSAEDLWEDVAHPERVWELNRYVRTEGAVTHRPLAEVLHEMADLDERIAAALEVSARPQPVGRRSLRTGG